MTVSPTARPTASPKLGSAGTTRTCTTQRAECSRRTKSSSSSMITDKCAPARAGVLAVCRCATLTSSLALRSLHALGRLNGGQKETRVLGSATPPVNACTPLYV